MQMSSTGPVRAASETLLPLSEFFARKSISIWHIGGFVVLVSTALRLMNGDRCPFVGNRSRFHLEPVTPWVRVRSGATAVV